ncbi:MAG: hypothetical protein ACK4YP_00425 [Myxococcota bacterium]
MHVSFVILLVACGPGPDGKGPTDGSDAVDTGADTADTGRDTAADDTAADSAPDDTAADTAPDDTAADTAPDGAEVPVAGARILEDDGTLRESLAGRGDLGPGPGEELVVSAGGELLTVAIPAAGDVSLAAQTVGGVTVRDGEYVTEVALGDLDGDGWTDVLRLGGTYEMLSDSPYEEFFRYTPVLTAFLGPLADGPDPAWTVTLDTVTGSSAMPSLVLDDPAGDGSFGVLLTLGTSAGYGGETAAWRIDAAGGAARIGASDGLVWGVDLDVRAVGDIDGDGIVDLSVESWSDTRTNRVALHPGPLGESFPAEADAAATLDGSFDHVTPLGDLDGDGHDDVAFVGDHAWIVPGPWSTGEVEAAAVARIDPEADDPADSAFRVTAGDVGADGVRDLVVADTYWPVAHGLDWRRGAVYVFHGLPAGTRGARTADTRVYGAEEGDYFGGGAMVLDDGRVAVQGYRDRDAANGESWAVWLLEGL